MKNSAQRKKIRFKILHMRYCCIEANEKAKRDSREERAREKNILIYLCTYIRLHSCSKSVFLLYNIASQSEPREDYTVGNRSAETRSGGPKVSSRSKVATKRKPTCTLRYPSDSFIQAMWCIIFIICFTASTAARHENERHTARKKVFTSLSFTSVYISKYRLYRFYSPRFIYILK